MPIVDPGFDLSPRPLGGVKLPAPFVLDGSARALRGRAVAFAAKRYVDMLYVSGLDRATADRHFRPRAVAVPGGLEGNPEAPEAQAALAAAWPSQVSVTADDAEARVTVCWTDDAFGPPIRAVAIARPGYGGILLGDAGAPRFDPVPIARPAAPEPWPLAAMPAMDRHGDELFAANPGLYGVVLAAPGRILFERYGAFGHAGRVTPSWSMTKSMTATMIGRLLHEGWLGSVHAPAAAPLWRDPRGIHAAISIDDLLRMRAGLALPVLDGCGAARLGYEAGLVYQDADDAFDVAQRSMVATRPGRVFRYGNAGPNVLGAVIRAGIEARGLPYVQTQYALLADRIGMASFQHSADIAGNLIASGSGFATARDYAKLGVLYLQDGCWDGLRLLPEGWVDYALRSNHAGTNYAASFRTNVDLTFPSLPADTAWAAGASDQRIVILRGAGLVAVVTNETDHRFDVAALDRFLAAAVDAVGSRG